MKLLFTILLCVLTITSHTGQTFSSPNPDYITNVKLGESALKAEKYDSCIVYYKLAFDIQQTSYLSTMRAAACGFSSKDADYMDLQLNKAFELNWGGAKQTFEAYEEFEYLQESDFADMVDQRYMDAATDAGVDIEMMEEMDGILYEDQRYRGEMNVVSKAHGWDSPQMDSLWVLQNKADSINTARISEIIDENGYPGKSIVGERHASTSFLVIQHADQETQEKYLPIITAAADEGEVRWSSVALLIDRVNLKQGKKQVYGSQVSRDPDTEEHFFLPIENPMKIDSIRESVGLGPLQQYADNWEFIWDPEKHITRHAKEDATEKKE